MALGATGPRVQFGVLADALRMAFIGVALGTAGSLAAAKWMASLLYGTGPRDPATFAAIALLLGLVALVASYIPARRASNLDPMIALREN